MSSFDIGTLLNFEPPRYLCEKCKGILFKKGLLSRFQVSEERKEIACPICKVKYRRTDEYHWYAASEYLKDKNLTIEFDNPIEHGRKLAAIAYNFSEKSERYPPMRALLEAISTATKFVHFTTYGLSHSIYGALKLKAQTVPIRGIASNIQADFAKQIRQFTDEAPRLELEIFEQSNYVENRDKIPHQKLVVIDGLMAFKGAANMTDAGWRKAASGRDFIEIVTDVQTVAKLNNELFSPIWAERSTLKSEIDMDW